MVSTLNPTSAEQIGHNNDVLTEILRNLPPKTLLKFKLVSNQWKSLLSTPSFCFAHARTLHAKALLKPSALFIHSPSDSDSDSALFLAFLPLNLDYKPRFPNVDSIVDLLNVNILQSCTGLLLCKASKLPRLCNDPVPALYFVCNPTYTEMYKLLSIPLPQSEGFAHVAVALAFDPLKSPFYKIFSIWSPDDHNTSTSTTLSVDLYSSKTNSWMPLKFTFTSNRSVDHKHGVYCRGAIHWYNHDEGSVMYLDVEKECVKTMPLPNNVGEGERVLGQCGDHLSLVVVHNNANPFTFSVFEMADDGLGWHLKYSLNLGPKLNTTELLRLNDVDYRNDFLLGSGNLVCGSHLVVYPIHEGSEFMLLPDGQVGSCRLKDFKGLKQPGFQLKYGKFQVFQYFETLFRV